MYIYSSNIFSIVTSYSNPLGSGNRNGMIVYSQFGNTLTANYPTLGTIIFNGFFTPDNVGYANGPALGTWMMFDFGTPRIIQEVKWYQDTSWNMGTWQWQGSNDSVNWSNIGGNFILGIGIVTSVLDPYNSTYRNESVQTQTSLNDNRIAYRYYKLSGVSGTMSYTPYIHEIEFKIN